MTFSISVVVNSITFNNFNRDSVRTPFKANPVRHYRQTATMRSSKSSRNTHMIGHLNGIPGGTSTSVLKTSEDSRVIDCDTVGIVQKLVIPKSIYTLALNDPNKCSELCSDPEKIARNRVRQSNTTVSETFFSRGVGYLQNRNKTYERKTTNFLDREESTALYGSYDKQMFFLRNSHTTGSLAGCAISYYKPTNSQFATDGAVSSSSITGRKKYNVDNLCRTRIPQNEYFFGITNSVDRKRYKQRVCCFPPDPNEVTYEKIQNVVANILADISTLRDIVNDNNARVLLGTVEKISAGNYSVPIVIENINLSQLDEVESVNLLRFLREKFEINNINPDLAVQILGLNEINYNEHFNNNGTRFYIDPTTLRVTYLKDVLKEPLAYIEKTGFVRIDEDTQTTVIEMEIDGLDREITGERLEAFKLYIGNLYLLRYGVKYTSIELV
jgi:hypothetical protein